jgi:hypothetical protein
MREKAQQRVTALVFLDATERATRSAATQMTGLDDQQQRRLGVLLIDELGTDGGQLDIHRSSGGGYGPP